MTTTRTTDGVSIPAQARRRRRARLEREVGETPQERAARGAALRRQVPLDSHACLPDAASRPDPVTLLEEQATSRVPELLPIRYGRMLVSPFTFYRGAAAVMAADLATTPTTGLHAQICGDAHLSNFGLYGSPERRLVFDINDFDETLPGPWEWDLKRLAASLVVAGRGNGLSTKQCRSMVRRAVHRYRTAMQQFAGMRDLDVWYVHAEMDELRAVIRKQIDAKQDKRLREVMAKARSRDSAQALAKLTDVVDGRRQMRSDPPLLVPVADLLQGVDADEFRERMQDLLRDYRQTVQPHLRVLLERYRFVDMARKVVGVGSVGTRCWVVLLVGRDDGDALFLQVKEAGPSVLSAHLGASEYANQGRRVVAGQQLMQATSDIFLGWQHTAGLDGKERDFYVRQLRDWKGSATVEAMRPRGLRVYGELCAWCLARAHARSGDRIAIAGYLGDGAAFAEAVTDFADGYADVNERDHAALAAAVDSGRTTARNGL